MDYSGQLSLAIPTRSDGLGGAVDRRRSIAAISTSRRLSCSPPTIEDIQVDTSDDDDDDDEDEEETSVNVRLLSQDIEDTGDLHLGDPLQIPTSTMEDCSPLEELDRVTMLQSFSPVEDRRHRRPLASALRYSHLYRCYSTDVDPMTSSPSLSCRSPRRRRTSWSSFDDATLVYPAPAVERCRQHVHFMHPDVEHESTQHAMSSADCPRQLSLATPQWVDAVSARLTPTEARPASQIDSAWPFLAGVNLAWPSLSRCEYWQWFCEFSGLPTTTQPGRPSPGRHS